MAFNWITSSKEIPPLSKRPQINDLLNYYYISFQDLQSFFSFSFFVSVINAYHTNGLNLF